MKEKYRLDKLLVLNNYVENVTKAKALIMTGNVLVNELKVEKPGTKFIKDIHIRIKKKPHEWVSRGGIKLSYAIEKLNIKIDNRVCADIGSSTGGFSEVLLNKKAKHVFSVDVGKGLLNWKIATNYKVTVLDSTNARYLSIDDISPKISFITVDLSFISITKALDKIASSQKKSLSILALVKPQFELTRDMIGKNGVVTCSLYREKAISKVCEWFKQKGWTNQKVIKSPITGAAGNIEYFIYCER